MRGGLPLAHPVFNPVENDLPGEREIVQLAMRPGSFGGRGDAEFLRWAATSFVECLGLAYSLVAQLVFAGHGEERNQDLRRVDHEPAPYPIHELL